MAKLTEEQRQKRAVDRSRREALQAEERDRQDKERREMWRLKGMYLTWEEYLAGEPCRNCGLVLNDARGSWPGTMHLSPAEKIEYEAEDARFRTRHADCWGARWCISGSRTWHCSTCCPPHPTGPGMAERLSKILASGPSWEERKKHQDAWELTLTCDHTARFVQHREHNRVSPSVVECPECGTRRGIVAAKRIGPAYTDEIALSDREAADKNRLKAELTAAKAKLARQQRSAAETQRRINELEGQLRADRAPR
ncbi:hypothetical protein ACFPFX_33255 [Streptomyces mauvecolor]|uniref:Uncharacterized protein n=1 Tax=Streptomyces mauvecolor TaxID=58345 RepID=A0ABV9UXJ6_9ACTN